MPPEFRNVAIRTSYQEGALKEAKMTVSLPLPLKDSIVSQKRHCWNLMNKQLALEWNSCPP